MNAKTAKFIDREFTPNEAAIIKANMPASPKVDRLHSSKLLRLCRRVLAAYNDKPR
jgi:hypothetical protein